MRFAVGSGDFRWFPECLDMRFARQNVLLLHMDPPKVRSDPDLHQKCKLQDAILLAFSLQLIFFTFFSTMCSPPSVGSTFLKNDFKHSAFKNSLFGPLKPSNDDSLAHFFGTYRSLSRSVSHFSASVAFQNIALGCSPVHFSPPGPLLQKCLSATHLTFSFFFCIFCFRLILLCLNASSNCIFCSTF